MRRLPWRQKLEPRRNARKRKTKTIRKEAAKKAPPRRAARTKAKPTAKVAVKPRPVSQRAQPETVKPPPSRPPPPTAEEQRIGVVTHYYSHLSVVAMQLEPGTTLRVGDIIHIRGHTTDFTQKVESLEVNQAPVTEVGPNEDRGRKARAQPTNRSANVADQRGHRHRRTACRAEQQSPRR
jgi:ribosomal protein L21